MSLRNFFNQFVSQPLFREVTQALELGTPLVLTGIAPPAKPAYLAFLQQALQKPLLYLSSANQDLAEFQQNVSFFHRSLSNQPVETVRIFPALEPGPYSGLSPHAEVLEERSLTLWRLHRREVKILMASPIAAVERLSSFHQTYDAIPELVPGIQIPPEKLTSYLQSAGYIQEEPVTGVGTYSLRGGILDVFAPHQENPVRIEFFGDEVESLREFSIKSQRSIGAIPQSTLPPMREWLLDPSHLQQLAQAARLHWIGRTLSSEAEEKLERASHGEYFPGCEFLQPLLGQSFQTLVDYCPSFLMVLDEPADLHHWIDRWEKAAFDEYSLHLSQGDLVLPPESLFSKKENWNQSRPSRPLVFFDLLGTHHHALLPASANSAEAPVSAFRTHLSTRPAAKFHGNIRAFIEEIQKGKKRAISVFCVQSSRGKAERLEEILKEYDISCRLETATKQAGLLGSQEPGGLVTITVGEVKNGFQDLLGQFCLYGDGDIFDEVEVLAHPTGGKHPAGTFLSDFRELKTGDYVVHIDHGIGKFIRIREITAEGVSREFMVLNYAGDDKLYVPLERLDLIQKHSGGETARPTLDKLGGTSWIRTKSRIRKSMRDMADELLKLYAERKINPGYSFSLSGHWHQEFEEAFEFVETPDQVTAIQEVTRDMESEGPMDRLLCGDVGFGKTEVAMRAAFKASFDGKQVAVLAPTTILVYQHYLRFKQRFTAFPMSIEMLSRFRDRKEQKRILEELALGKIDILIGTHRLLSKDLQFRDLGLLIIDEEQQFGVVHKERLKQLKKRVDTLTMTATPIPRTLHMSLMGIRDMSIIETPPKNRLSIQTMVVPFGKQIIQRAIEQELERQGQVYFVHNRVEDIHKVVSMIQQICPKAKIVIGHGQMGEKELETAMLQFVRHEADILVSTTIIENGLDIPLVNTMIVNNADRFGLAQLYQLRGRVGRSDRRAYAYLLVPGDKVLTGDARQRLAALKEFSELGSGFKIAALDLELRGAGNLLGGEQHGHINAVGFDLYCQMLERTIEELNGAAALPEVQTQINLRIPIKIPAAYIPEENQRLRTYKRISGLKTEGEVSDLRAELEDRYGPLPVEVENLMDYARLRLAAEKCLVKSLERQKDGITIQFHEKTPVMPERLVEIVSSEPGISITPAGHLKVEGSWAPLAELLPALRALLLDLSGQG